MSDIYFPDAGLPLETVEAGRVCRKIRARGGQLMMVEVYFEAGACGAEHRHPHEQMSYCLDGEFVFTVDGDTATLRAGDSLYVPGGAAAYPSSVLMSALPARVATCRASSRTQSPRTASKRLRLKRISVNPDGSSQETATGPSASRLRG